jgi:predicted lipid-binding transport protein (Tim44 family)
MQNRYRGRDIYVGDADLNAFQSIHAAVQEAWGRGDLGQMRQLMTPEMLSYFSQEMTRNSSQGVQNLVSNVTLVKAELTESWEENDMQYATAYMRWTALDYTVRIGAAPSSPGALVAGDRASRPSPRKSGPLSAAKAGTGCSRRSSRSSRLRQRVIAQD